MRSALLFICLGFLAFGQNTERLRDSIVKYKISNPSLAIEYGIQYTDDDLSQISNSKTVGTHALIGEILLDMGLYASALNYFNRSIELFNSLPDSEIKNPVAQPPWVILNIGNIYFQNGDFEKAKVKFNEAKRLFQQYLNIEDKQNGLNTSDSNLALIMESEGDYDSAEKIYQEIYLRRLKSNKLEDILYSIAQLIVIKLHKKEFVAAENKLQELIQLYKNQKTPVSKTSIITRNYGYAFLVYAAYYQSIKDYEKAIKYLNKSKTILKHFPNEVNALGSRFAECYLGLNDFNTAQEIAKENLKIKNLNESEKRYNYRVLEKIYKKKGFNSELLKIKDSLILISSGSPSARIFKSLNNLEIQIQLANSARQLNEDRIRYNTYLYILIICSVILFFSLVTIRVNYNYQKIKGKSLELEKEVITSKLNEKNRELVSKANFIYQTNEYLKNIKKKIESKNQVEQISINKLSRELSRVINSEKTYDDFDKMFVEVYPDFYSKLNSIAEIKLSQTDLRLASLIKMNHNNSEISTISGISIRTVESQRYRLLKKLSLDKDQNLNSFILEI